MRRNWTNRNVDLKILKEKIIEFLKENYFDMDVNENGNQYLITAKSSPNYYIEGQIAITLQGKPEEFSIDIELRRKKQRIFSPLLLAFLGGGYWLSQNLKSDEEWLEFRRKFWEQIDIFITYLSGSAH
jgi:hypothetical protein